MNEIYSRKRTNMPDRRNEWRLLRYFWPYRSSSACHIPMCSEFHKVHVKCIEWRKLIMNQIWFNIYCLWTLDTFTIVYEKINTITVHIFITEQIFICKVYIWINIAKFPSNTHLSSIISNASLVVTQCCLPIRDSEKIFLID